MVLNLQNKRNSSRNFKKKPVFLLILIIVLILIIKSKLKVKNEVLFNGKKPKKNFLSTLSDYQSYLKFKKNLIHILPQNKTRYVFSPRIPNKDFEFELSDSVFEKIEEEKTNFKKFALTIGIYLNYILYQKQDNEQKEVKAHFCWTDWIDKRRDDVKKQIEYDDLCLQYFSFQKNNQTRIIQLENMRKVCVEGKNFYNGFKIFGHPGQQVIQNYGLYGLSFLIHEQKAPRKIVFLTHDKGSFDVHTINQDEVPYDKKLGSSSILKEMINSNFIINNKINVYSIFKDFSSKILTKKKPNKYEKGLSTLPLDYFDIDVNEIVLKLDSQPEISVNEQFYLNSLKYLINEKSPPKYFNEVYLDHQEKNFFLGLHYDWRFFSKLVVDKTKKIMILHRILKIFLSFCSSNDVVVWIAHGTLLSWYWNGLIFPYDSDIDVQVPIMSLHQIAMSHNQSIIVEPMFYESNNTHYFDGLGRFFFDVGSSITHRTKGNSKNNIDARFIDIDSGLYIDITGLSVSDSMPNQKYLSKSQRSFYSYHNFKRQNVKILNKKFKFYNCRNNHFVNFDEIFPLKTAVMENQLCYVPANYLNILRNEYNPEALTNEYFSTFVFIPFLELWVNRNELFELHFKPSSSSDYIVTGFKNLKNYNTIIYLLNAKLSYYAPYLSGSNSFDKTSFINNIGKPFWPSLATVND